MTSVLRRDVRDAVAEPAAGPAAVPAAVRRRLDPRLSDDGLRSWVPTLMVTLVAGLLRFVGLSHPPGKIFDEVYYATDAASLLAAGVELTDTGGPGFVAHPPLGKWCIAAGMWLFGPSGVGRFVTVSPEFGWRFSAAVAGTVAVLLVIRVGRRMFGSTLLGCIAGLLLTLDGLHLVTSRSALLDIFLATFVLAGFACLLRDRDSHRAGVLRAMEAGMEAGTQAGTEAGTQAGTGAGADAGRRLPPRQLPPRRGLATVPWWRLAGAAFLGAALGVKWSAVWYVIAFALLVIAWELGLRRTAGVRRRWADLLRAETGWTLAYGGTALLAYLATWTGWFASDRGWGRQWAEANGYSVAPGIDALISLGRYHYDVLTFHTGLETDHDYQSGPFSWLLLGRPVAFYYSGDVDCGAASCSSEVLALGTPLLWWSFVPALVIALWRWIAFRDWRAAAVVVGAAASFVPWMALPARTMFLFYALPAVPFLVLAVTLALGVVLGDRHAPRERRLTGAVLVGGYVAVIALAFLYFYPIYSADVLDYEEWRARMWFARWI